MLPTADASWVFEARGAVLLLLFLAMPLLLSPSPVCAIAVTPLFCSTEKAEYAQQHPQLLWSHTWSSMNETWSSKGRQ